MNKDRIIYIVFTEWKSWFLAQAWNRFKHTERPWLLSVLLLLLLLSYWKVKISLNLGTLVRVLTETIWHELYYTVSQKTPHLWFAITMTYMIHEWILMLFGRNITNKVGTHETLYYATSSNLCFCTTWQNGDTWKSHFHSVGLCYTHNTPVHYLPERKSCHLWCVW